ncbi:CaiB/BaiF CoA-transferase family protein [Agriterribacter sp.]|uniref:CaiB/BaiF CoA transferase family protein n=1 Tax=Agriterribacter sp. TaxID=2821509 RepID=UPI002D12E577|nr:CaiB/BaiF CoA-transferase family protein [Agriterribacter sp.]HRP57327.1 CaiB/BaiF CoA-transferase family protein [Agriterribacter sp.]
MERLLDGILVLDFSQFLSGPSCGLRLADLGARVIKIEREGSGDLCRELYVSDTKIGDGESTIFHAINRNKESFSINLKDPEALKKIKKLIASADVMLHNFRPGVMTKLGLDYDTVRQINPGIVYGEVSGYGDEGEWKDLPGQDLLLQAVSGITYLSGSKDDPPIPMGIAVADIVAGTHLGQGVLAALYRKQLHGTGSLIQVSMLESLLDFQFEVLTCFLNDGNTLPVRSAVNGAHAYIAAPYGIYKTADGYIAIAMAPVAKLGELMQVGSLCRYKDPEGWFDNRDEIKAILQESFLQRTTADWLCILEPEDIWCADVYDYEDLLAQEGYRLLEMEQWVVSNAAKVKTTRCPVTIDGEKVTGSRGAPLLGEHNEKITRGFGL